MPNEHDCDPEDPSTWGPTDGHIAEQLGMTLGEVKEHLRALDKQGWVCDTPTVMAECRAQKRNQ